MIVVIGGNHILKEQTEKQLHLEISKNNANIHILWKRCTKTKLSMKSETVTKKNLVATSRSLNVPSNSKHSMVL